MLLFRYLSRPTEVQTPVGPQYQRIGIFTDTLYLGGGSNNVKCDSHFPQLKERVSVYLDDVEGLTVYRLGLIVGLDLRE